MSLGHSTHTVFLALGIRRWNWASKPVQTETSASSRFDAASLMSSQYDKPRQASAPSYIRGFPRRPGGQGWCCAPFTECFEGQNVLFIVSLAPQCRRNPASGTSNVVPLRPLTRSLDSPAFPVGSSGRLDWRFSWLERFSQAQTYLPLWTKWWPCKLFLSRKEIWPVTFVPGASPVHPLQYTQSFRMSEQLLVCLEDSGRRTLSPNRKSLTRLWIRFPWLIRPEAKLAHWESGHSTISASVSQFILDSGWLVRYRACI